MKTVKSINPFKSEIQTIYDIVKANCGGIKVKAEEYRVPDVMIIILTDSG